MKNTLRFDHDARCIVMDRTFYKNSSNIRFAEYGMLQRARQDYPTYTPVIKHIKRNPNKETYRGLTYAYMERYIESHDDDERTIWAEYKMYRGEPLDPADKLPVAYTYKQMQTWFLDKYEVIAKFYKDIA